eukprot:TRINITY_DN1053_c0_g3_i1.p1 TRINITY_DN1053_c0_g3~~TRINITY_DN1053_c0_g3_i1.p1  ORF type:complete len:460 (-),score=181.11 TRINITY_DN1053_c0_g3_i1:77-1456(-)
MAAAWEESLTKAEEAAKESKFFDGVQFINSCMEEYSKTLGEESERIVKEPEAFMGDMLPKVTEEQKAMLGRMYAVRGDIICGLGAHKRAVTDYGCALSYKGAGDEALAAKKAAAEQAAKGPGPAKSEKIPVTILAGFLGAGKTTLLNNILKENHGKRVAIIENEFGEVGIDDGLIEPSQRLETEENIIEMNNGCICCTIRGDLIAGLKKIVKKAQKETKQLDMIIIETTGLADPAPVAQTFFADDFVQQKLALDGILTVVDAKHIIQHLDEEKPDGVENEAVEQIAFADRILLNKTDLVEESYLTEVERRIRMINEGVQIKRCQQSKVDMDFLLGIKAFDLDKILEMDDGFLDDDAEHQHDDRVSSVGFNVVGEVNQDKLNSWLGWLLKERGTNLFRTKGILAVQGMSDKFVFQAVHMAFSGAPQRPWADGEERRCRLTFIGKDLNKEELETGFKDCLV